MNTNSLNQSLLSYREQIRVYGNGKQRLDTANIDEDDEHLGCEDLGNYQNEQIANSARDQFVSTLSRLRPLLKHYNKTDSTAAQPKNKKSSLAQLLSSPNTIVDKNPKLTNTLEDTSELNLTKDAEGLGITKMMGSLSFETASNKFDSDFKFGRQESPSLAYGGRGAA